MSSITNPYVRRKQRRHPISDRHAKTCLNPACGKTFLSYDYAAKYCSRDCFQAVIAKPPKVTDSEVRKEEAALRGKCAVDVCTCGNFHTCLKCRNAERRRAFKAGEVPVYRAAVLALAATD